MNISRNALPPIFFALLIVGGCGATWWLLLAHSSGAGKPPPVNPAVVAHPIKEPQLNTIALSDEAVKNLNLQIAAVERKSLPRVRVYGGEVMPAIGKSVIVAAPLTGTLRAAADAMPRAGEAVALGRVLFELLPLVTPEGRANLAAAKIDAEGQVKSAQTQWEAAQIALNRAKKLLAGEAGSQRAVDEAQAHVDLAKENLDAAKARAAVLDKVAGELDDGTAAPIPIAAPQPGLLRSVSAMNGQSVPAGAPLFEVVNLDSVWIRVPVYVGDATEVDTAAKARIGNLTARPGKYEHAARPIAAPPTANAASGTLDMYYELDNRHAGYRPGQRVGVSLALAGAADSLTVPWSAVIHDIYGGTWVYEATGPREFVRRRVVVRYVIGDAAVLAAGPPAGAEVVAAGAAELFGTETGFSK
ncbi:MAG: efflux RND transporter periplasmic adaptor subunit [Planctomycetota bacterium]|nr:MAG: efflux RND transporter periplasmic adaptor subunit [Planctomycetota bacterium]